MKLKKWNYCKVTEYYELEITDEYLKSLTAHFKANAVNPDEIPEITKTFIKEAYYGKWEDDIIVTFKGWKDNTFEASLYDQVRDIVYEDLCDNFREAVDSESYDDDTELEYDGSELEDKDGIKED